MEDRNLTISDYQKKIEELESRIAIQHEEFIQINEQLICAKGKAEEGERVLRKTNEDLKQIIQKQIELEKRLEYALTSNHIGAWEVDLITHDITRTPEHDKIFGYETMLPNWTYEIFLDHVVESDRPSVDEKFNKAIDTRCEWDFECRIRRCDGEIRWIWACGRHQLGAEGDIYRMSGILQDITVRKKTEEELLKRSEEIETFFNCAIDLLCIANTKGEFLRLNKEWERVLGYTLSELQSGKFLDFVHPDDLEETLMALEQLSNQIKVINFVNRYRCKNGEYRWIEWKSYPHGDKVYAAARDITERENMETALAHSRDLMRYIIEHNRSSVAVHDRNMRYVYVSQRYLDEYNIKDRDIIGKHHYEIFPDIPQKWRDVHQKALEGIISSADNDPYQRDDGTVEWTRWECRPWFEADGSIGGIIIYTEVISERKKLEEDLIRKNMELEASEEEIRSSHEELLATSEALRESNTALQAEKEKAEESERHLRLLIEFAPEAIFIQTNWQFAYLNQKAVELFGASTIEELLDQKVLDRFHPDYKAQVNGLNELSLAQSSLEQIAIRLDGSFIDVEVSAVPFKHLGKNGALVFVRDITERKHYEEKLRRSYNLLRNLTSQVLGVVYQYRLYQDGRSAFPYSSPGMYDIYEVTSEEVRQDASPVFTRIHPDDIDYIRESIYESAREQTVYHSEFRVILPTQGLRWRHCDARPELLDDGSTLWYGIITDITDRKNAEERIKQQQLLFETVFNTITDGVIITNTERIILLANQGIELTFGYKPDEIIGQSTRILYEDSSKFEESGENVFNESSLYTDNIFMTRYRDKFNNTFPGETFAAKLYNTNGEWIGNLGIMRNISERVKYIDELKIAREKAEESNRLKNAFLQNMSHEIRTPMNAIIGFSEMLKEAGLSDEKKGQYFDIIVKSTNQLLSVVTDIITISSIDTKQEKLNLTEININSVIDDLYVIFVPKANEAGLTLIKTCGLENEQAEIYTDEVKVNQILTNLISNALKFTHQGFIEYGYTLKENMLEFYVKDTGIGIHRDMHEIIFERFRQADISTSRKYGGTGLGLSISQGLVELLGGSIWVDSEPDKGAAFYFSVPYNQVTEYKKSEIFGTVTGKSFTILVAEDEEINYYLIEELMSDCNMKFIHAKNGIEAVEICKSNFSVDLVLMDIKMPQMDGYTATEIIKKHRPDLPIIAQTAYALESEIKQFGEIFDAYITKPINKDILKSRLNEYLNTAKKG